MSPRKLNKKPISTQLMKSVQKDLNAGLLAHKNGDLKQAEQFYKKVLSIAPAQPDAMNHLGIIKTEIGDLQYGIDLLRTALRKRPKDITILTNLGHALTRARQFTEAIQHLELAISLAPSSKDVIGKYIHALRATGQIDFAKSFIQHLKRISPNDLLADFENARLLADIGDTEAANTILKLIIKEQPNYAPAWLAYAKGKKWRDETRFSDRIIDQISSTAEQSKARQTLCYAAGKVFDDLGDYDQAFKYYQLAKEQENVPYYHEKMKQKFEAIKSTVTPAFFRKKSHSGLVSKRPVFIVGMPRSGTSLTEQILASHPDVFGAGELDYIGRARKQIATLTPKNTPYPRAMNSASSITFKVLAMRYLRLINTHSSSARFVTDKMPHNFMALGLISMMFPKASIIHCLRNPVDNCLSCFMQSFTQNHAYNRSLSDLGHYYNLYRDLMEHYEKTIPLDILSFQYEDSVADQERASKRLLDHIGLDWNSNVLEFHKTKRRVGTPSNWQVRQPIYKSSQERWRNYETHLSPLIDAIDPKYLN